MAIMAYPNLWKGGVDMTLLIEFMSKNVDCKQVDEWQRQGRIRLLERAQVQPNGSVGIFLKWFELPGYSEHFPLIPEDIEEEGQVRYTYRQSLFDKYRLREGIYRVEGVEHLSVSYGLERTTEGAYPVSRIAVVSESSGLVMDCYEDLRNGKLRPEQEWSTPGLVEAPKSEEGSGSHPLPPMAVTATKAA